MQAVGPGRGHGSASALARGVSHTRKHVALGPRVRYVATSAASFGAASHLSVHDFAYQVRCSRKALQSNMQNCVAHTVYNILDA
jgi:hypothetical protein